MFASVHELEDQVQLAVHVHQLHDDVRDLLTRDLGVSGSSSEHLSMVPPALAERKVAATDPAWPALALA